MKLSYHRTAQSDVPMYGDSEDILSFTCTQPVVIQPGEIKKVPTGLTLQIQPGSLLVIYTAPFLWQQGSEVFPAALVLDQTAQVSPLEIPIRNSSRNQLNIHPGQIIAFGIGQIIERLSLEEFQPATAPVETKSSRPQKKNPDIKFEIR